MIVTFLILGWLSAAVFAFSFLKVRYQALQEKTEKEMIQKEYERRVLEQKDFFAQTQNQMQQVFQGLASQTLETHSEHFLKLATERLDKKNIEAEGVLQKKVVEFQGLLNPMKDTLTQIQTDLNAVEKDRNEQFGRITEQLFQVTQTSEKLKNETSQLAKALRKPEVRGSWGEMQLRRVVELSGMSSYCDFEEQVVVRVNDDSQAQKLQKPDLVVRLPNNRIVIVDAKAVLDAFLDAVEADSYEQKQKALERHAKNLRSRVLDLSRKSYWEQFENSPEFAVLFIPNEALLSAAVEMDKSVIEDALKEKIIIATPTTLVALLKAVAFGWQQNQLAEGAQQMIEKVSDFYERLSPWLKHLARLGDSLNGAVKVYNESMSSLDTRVLPAARKIQELGFKDKNAIADLSEVEILAKKTLKNSPNGELNE